MSTRSAIIEKTGSVYRGIYCHFDGYEDGVGHVLLKHYQDPTKVKALIDLGDISSLGEVTTPPDGQRHSIDNPLDGITVAYGRDRGDDVTDPLTGNTIDEVAAQIGHNGHVYVFENSEWTYNGDSFTLKDCE